MPLLLRTVEPTHVSRGTLPARFPVPNDLEAVANGTLSNIIRQLSSLSHYAEELFLDLINVGSDIASRASNLQGRIDRLAVRVGQIDATQDESSASMQDSLHTKPFTSSLNFDQQVVSRSSLPPAMEKRFQLCDKPPPLDKLNVFRDDGKDGLKFYTDPSYFFDLWRQEMLKDTERLDKANKKPHHKLRTDAQNRHKKRVRQPHNTRERQRHLAIEQGELLMPSPNFQAAGSPIDGRNHSSPTPDGRLARALDQLPNNNELEYNRYMASEDYPRAPASNNNFGPNYESGYGKSVVNGYRPSQPPPAPPSNELKRSNVGPHSGVTTNTRATTRDAFKVSRNTLPPPPPLPRDDHFGVNGAFNNGHNESVLNDDLPLPPPPDNIPDYELHAAAAPPPPPPPPITQLNKVGKVLTVVREDGRSELLKAIRDGIELRKVETNDLKIDDKPSAYHDVASILARRVAVEMSDSDSSSDYGSDGWDETSA